MNPCKEARLKRIYQFIVEFKKQNDGLSPSMREIGQQLGVESTSLVSYYLKELEREGMIVLNPFNARGIRAVGGQ